jgi:L-lactate dehydrogenase complex protein LldG
VTEGDALVRSLQDLDVEAIYVPPAERRDAIMDFVVGDVVGIEDEAWTEPLSDEVAWDPTPAALWAADTGVKPAVFAIAEYGSLVLPTESPACELVSLNVDRHVAVVNESDVVPDMEVAFDRFADAIPTAYRDGIIATGPMPTADTGALVNGAHGASEVRVVVVEDA